MALINEAPPDGNLKVEEHQSRFQMVLRGPTRDAGCHLDTLLAL